MGSGVARIGGGYRYNDRVRVVLSIWGGSIYRVGSSRYIEREVVDLSTGADSFYRFADVVLSVSRPSAGNHPAHLQATLHAPVWAGAVIDAEAAGVVSYLRSFGAGVALNRGDDSPGTDSGRQATSCEPTSVSTLG